MQLDSLRIANIRKDSKAIPTFEASELREVFHVQTCQRYLWIFKDAEDYTPILHGVEIHRGTSAYRFLLQVASGLESQILGETDIFGQLKRAWQAYQGPLRQDLDPWIQRVFEDTKEIRSRYLQGLGGISYGSLIRRLIRKQSRVPEDEPVLLIGAGRIAEAITPFLTDHPILVWNRSSTRLLEFEKGMHVHLPHAEMKFFSKQSEFHEALARAAHLLVCVPVEVLRPPRRRDFLSVIHLGGLREQCDSWQQLPRFFSLSDIFDLQKSLTDDRSIHVTRAFRACDEKAKLRALGGSLSIPHGWEDLAIFAS